MHLLRGKTAKQTISLLCGEYFRRNVLGTQREKLILASWEAKTLGWLGKEENNVCYAPIRCRMWYTIEHYVND
jgi:hypothetical protein